jgi:hypothetical protein
VDTPADQAHPSLSSHTEQFCVILMAHPGRPLGPNLDSERWPALRHWKKLALFCEDMAMDGLRGAATLA